MALTPFRGFWDMQSEVDRLFNQMVGDLFGGRQHRGAGGARTQAWVPLMEAYARDGDLVIHADLPGISLEDVDITLEGNALTISGVRKGATEDIDYYVQELPYGEFRRSLTVPEVTDPDSIKARFENGVLEVVLPSAVAEAKPKKIAIEAG